MWPFKKRPKGPSYDGLIYAIGDIHGRADLLRLMLERIETDRGGQPGEIIFLGDYIDRGPDSRGVIDILLRLDEFTSLSPSFIKGNHEATLLDFVAGEPVGPAWAEFGAIDTLVSYGVRPPRHKTQAEAWIDVRFALRDALPEAHMDFYAALVTSIDRDPYFFAHAGIDPDKPIDQQSEHDLMWIRKRFLGQDRKLSRFVIHGHSARRSPIIGRSRLGIDTGAYSTGRLTAARIGPAGISLLETD